MKTLVGAGGWAEAVLLLVIFGILVKYEIYFEYFDGPRPLQINSIDTSRKLHKLLLSISKVNDTVHY